MAQPKRFKDENLLLSNFYGEALVICPACAKKAVAKADYKIKKVRLFCTQCGYNKEAATVINTTTYIQMPAQQYFDAELWLQAPFKNEVFRAFNEKHLDYLERYIKACLREHKDRRHYTLLEKLPKFYHEAKNRERLIKIIENLRNKD